MSSLRDMSNFLFISMTVPKVLLQHLSWRQGCGVGVEESPSEGFWTWGVRVAENFNDSDSGLTFCSPIVNVCATNVSKRHTWQFKQLNLSTKDDHGYSDRLQHIKSHAYTQGDSRSAATLGLITQLMLSECNLSRFASLRFPFAFILVGTIVALWR